MSLLTCNNEIGPGGVGRTSRGLTHSSDFTREGLAKATCSVPSCDRPRRGPTYCNPHLKRLQRTGDVMADKPIRYAPTEGDRDDIASRILRQSHAAENGCIEWTGARYSTGYGHISWRGRDWSVHRAIWTATNGPIPNGLADDGSEWTIDHLCGNRLCVNVEHLDVVSRIENTRRAGGLPKAVLARRTVPDPPHGHIQRYRRLGCRCEKCKTANTERTRANRAKRNGGVK